MKSKDLTAHTHPSSFALPTFDRHYEVFLNRKLYHQRGLDQLPGKYKRGR